MDRDCRTENGISVRLVKFMDKLEETEGKTKRSNWERD